MTNSDGSIHSEDPPSDSSASDGKPRGTRRTSKRSTGSRGRLKRSSRGPEAGAVIDASSFNRGQPPSNTQLYDPTAGQEDGLTDLRLPGSITRRGHRTDASGGSQLRTQNPNDPGETSAPPTDLPALHGSARARVSSLQSAQVASQPSGTATLPPIPESNLQRSNPHRRLGRPSAGSATTAQTQNRLRSTVTARIRPPARHPPYNSYALYNLHQNQSQSTGTAASLSASSGRGGGSFRDRAGAMAQSLPVPPYQSGRPSQTAGSAWGDTRPSQMYNPDSGSRTAGGRYGRDRQGDRNPAPNSAFVSTNSSTSRRNQNPAGGYSNGNASQAYEGADDDPSAAGRGPAR